MAQVVGKDVGAVKRCTCSKCASIIEYTPSELVERKHSHDYLGDYEVDDFLKCPKCGDWILIR